MKRKENEYFGQTTVAFLSSRIEETESKLLSAAGVREEFGGVNGCWDWRYVGIGGQVGMQFQIGGGCGLGWSLVVCVWHWQTNILGKGSGVIVCEWQLVGLGSIPWWWTQTYQLLSTLNPTRSLSRNAGLLVSYTNYLTPPQTTSTTNLKLHTNSSSNHVRPPDSTSFNPPKFHLTPEAGWRFRLS